MKLDLETLKNLFKRGKPEDKSEEPGSPKRKEKLLVIVPAVIVVLGVASYLASNYLFKGEPKSGPAKTTVTAKPGAPKTAPAAAKPGESKPPVTPAPAKSKPAEAAPAPAPVNPIPFYEYGGGRRRDPFTPLIVKTETEKKRGATPIEGFEVSELRLIAILWNKAGYYAMVTLPDGKSYTVREGTKLGLHGGKVYKITRDSVIIREQITDYKGKTKPKDTILKLRGEEQG